MLLYAKTDEEISVDVKYKIGKNTIEVMTLNLGLEFSNIAEQLDSIILRYFNK